MVGRDDNEVLNLYRGECKFAAVMKDQGGHGYLKHSNVLGRIANRLSNYARHNPRIPHRI
jgi:hypothetical protein